MLRPALDIGIEVPEPRAIRGRAVAQGNLPVQPTEVEQRARKRILNDVGRSVSDEWFRLGESLSHLSSGRFLQCIG
jgi:hypothetical protein